MFGKKYALRDINTGESESFDDPHEAAQWARYHGCVRDETGKTFDAMRTLGYDHNGERVGTGGMIFGNLFGLNEPDEPAASDDKTFVDRLFGL